MEKIISNYRHIIKSDYRNSPSIDTFLLAEAKYNEQDLNEQNYKIEYQKILHLNPIPNAIITYLFYKNKITCCIFEKMNKRQRIIYSPFQKQNINPNIHPIQHKKHLQQLREKILNQTKIEPFQLRLNLAQLKKRRMTNDHLEYLSIKELVIACYLNIESPNKQTNQILFENHQEIENITKEN